MRSNYHFGSCWLRLPQSYLFFLPLSSPVFNFLTIISSYHSANAPVTAAADVGEVGLGDTKPGAKVFGGDAEDVVGEAG